MERYRIVTDNRLGIKVQKLNWGFLWFMERYNSHAHIGSAQDYIKQELKSSGSK